jgi:hypothetical protein
LAQSTNKTKAAPKVPARKKTTASKKASPKPGSASKKVATTVTRKAVARKKTARGAASETRGGAATDVFASIEALAGRLDASCDRLTTALTEVPTPTDFEPFAEHLYQLARYAPRLLEAVEALPRVEASVESLKEVSETLQFVHSSFDESILRLPRAEDYEPLAQPLREFARVSPALAESLASVLRTTTPLTDAVRTLRQVTEGIQAAKPQRVENAPPPARSAETLRAPLPDGWSVDALVGELGDVASEVHSALGALQGALESLPADPVYKQVAAQLRELATVSPSLMEWLSQVETVSQPLGNSVGSLQDSVRQLSAAHERLQRIVDELSDQR